MIYLTIFLLGYLFHSLVEKFRPRKRVHRRRPHPAAQQNPFVGEIYKGGNWDKVQNSRPPCEHGTFTNRKTSTGTSSTEKDVVSALVNFGSKKGEAQKLVSEIARPGLPFEELFKMATVRIAARSRRVA